jgi:ATP-binding cassette subfamily F protein 3
LSGELTPLQGRYTTSAGLKIGYFAQHQVQALNLENSAFDHLLALDRQLTDQQIRDYLGGFGFHGDEALKKVAPMSGGEKARLVLSLIVYSKPNLLLLDEPTNHLDMNMREALAYALQSFEGAMVIVSHDRYLLESVCDDFYLVDNGAVSSFSGDLPDYQKWLFANKADRRSIVSAEAKSEVSSIDRKVLKRLEAEFRQSTKAFRESIAKSEKQISKYQGVLEATENKMVDTSLYEAENKHLLNGLIATQVDAKNQIEELEMEWLASQEQLELAEAEFERSKASS